VIVLAVDILGCSGSYAAAGGACSGYLMQSPQAKVWLDAGPGTLSNLQKVCSIGELDAVVLTHAHPDHWLEIPVVANAISWYEPRARLPVYSNAHTAAHARNLIGPEIDGPFDWRVIEVDDVVNIADQRWTFAETDHYVPTFATRVDVDGESIVFSSDTGPAFSLRPMVERSGPIDLALVESTFLERGDNPDALHLAAPEAGMLAHEAGVKKLLLTHLAPHEDQQAHLAAAARNFSGDIVLAQVGHQYAASDT